MLYVSPDMSWIVTTNVSSATVRMEKTAPGWERPGAPPPGPRGTSSGEDWNETVVPVGNGSEGFDVSADGKEIWVANAQDGTVSIIDVLRKKVTQTWAADVGGANRLKFTADGKLALVSTLGGPNLTVIDASARKTIKRIPVGHGVAGIVVQPDGLRAIVACSRDGYVALVDLHSLEQVSRIEVGKDPDGMAWVTRH
jgi:DNA-binding beta-propeller fold protein YncE